MEVESLRPFLVLSAIAAVAAIAWIGIYRAKLSPLGGSRHLEVLETTMLAQGATLHLVRIGSRRFAIARSGQAIELICEVAIDDDAAPEVSSRGGSSSLGRLRGFLRR